MERVISEKQRKIIKVKGNSLPIDYYIELTFCDDNFTAKLYTAKSYEDFECKRLITSAERFNQYRVCSTFSSERDAIENVKEKTNYILEDKLNDLIFRDLNKKDCNKENHNSEETKKMKDKSEQLRYTLVIICALLVILNLMLIIFK